MHFCAAYTMLGEALLLFVCLLAVKSQVEQSPESVRLRHGQSVRLTCIILSSAAYCHDLVWYFQRNTEAPQRIHTGQESSKSGSSLSKNCSLQIGDLKITDSGTYFCSLCWFTASYFGNGTKLIVSDRAEKKPSIFIMGPSRDMTALKCNVTLVCLVYDPSEDMKIYWNVSGEHVRGEMGSEIISTDGAYSITNDLTLSYDTWTKQPSIQCAAGTQNKAYVYTQITKDASFRVNRTQIILGSISIILLIVVISTIVYYRIKLRLAQVNESDKKVWETRASNNQTVIYQTVKGAGHHTKKGKKKIKKKREEKEYKTVDIHYATLELHSK